MAVKDRLLKFLNIVNTDCNYVLWFQLKNVCFYKVDDVLFGTVYIPPENSKLFFRRLNKSF